MRKWKPTKSENPDFKCRKCDSDDVWYQRSNDEYEDTHYECRSCGYDWWVEGLDY